MDMLTQDDLQAIGQLIDEKAFKPLQNALDGKIDGLRTEMNTKFDAVQEQLDSIENRMITQEGLERWETGLTERYDKRYVRQQV